MEKKLNELVRYIIFDIFKQIPISKDKQVRLSLKSFSRPLSKNCPYALDLLNFPSFIKPLECTLFPLMMLYPTLLSDLEKTGHSINEYLRIHGNSDAMRHPDRKGLMLLQVLLLLPPELSQLVTLSFTQLPPLLLHFMCTNTKTAAIMERMIEWNGKERGYLEKTFNIPLLPPSAPVQHISDLRLTMCKWSTKFLRHPCSSAVLWKYLDCSNGDNHVTIFDDPKGRKGKRRAASSLLPHLEVCVKDFMKHGVQRWEIGSQLKRRVIDICDLSGFAENPEEWHKKMERIIKEQSSLSELMQSVKDVSDVSGALCIDERVREEKVEEEEEEREPPSSSSHSAPPSPSSFQQPNIPDGAPIIDSSQAVSQGASIDIVSILNDKKEQKETKESISIQLPTEPVIQDIPAAPFPSSLFSKLFISRQHLSFTKTQLENAASDLDESVVKHKRLSDALAATDLALVELRARKDRLAHALEDESKEKKKRTKEVNKRVRRRQEAEKVVESIKTQLEALKAQSQPQPQVQNNQDGENEKKLSEKKREMEERTKGEEEKTKEKEEEKEEEREEKKGEIVVTKPDDSLTVKTNIISPSVEVPAICQEPVQKDIVQKDNFTEKLVEISPQKEKEEEESYPILQSVESMPKGEEEEEKREEKSEKEVETMNSENIHILQDINFLEERRKALVEMVHRGLIHNL
eukprot:gnl/Carplike_NY0171/2575_a3457_540.p1 GENE.gnl/Carplike_NY0171/2575_a3457_540~~gnl/Carplike_NY0171/2575_a3457_540.p1  ORF type:complete len:785 (-),score=265.96 gnl/Carplike_NY0171/2575_a3457_540:65-2134(-)